MRLNYNRQGTRQPECQTIAEKILVLNKFSFQYYTLLMTVLTNLHPAHYNPTRSLYFQIMFLQFILKFLSKPYLTNSQNNLNHILLFVEIEIDYKFKPSLRP